MYDNPSSEPSSSRALTSANETDNLIRRRLRVSDPRDPEAVAEGLRQLFPKERALLERESSGLPIIDQPVARPRPETDGPTSAELQQAHDDIDRDLRSLIGNSQLKDIEPELQGWSQAIRSLTAEGHAAARLALDPRSRDRAFAARRALGDYARLARMVGALTCDHNQAYRRLAQSLDEAGALILVALGESLARIGFGGGRFLLQAPASELQARRDSVINALRNLTGTTAEAYGSQDWPYGLHGLRNVLKLLDNSGHADLRALFDENSLARLMDDLLDQASAYSARGLRALGATAMVAVQRLNRLVQVVGNNVDPGSPPLTAFIEAIRLFTDAFQSSGSGYRLLFVARPPAVFYGLYGIGGQDDATRRLLEMIAQRGRLAELLDCYLGCSCCQDPAICQILLDKLLYDTDRAIDLHLQGTDPNGDGEPEWRAAGYGLLIETFLTENDGQNSCLTSDCLPVLADLQPTLEIIRDQLVDTGNPALPVAHDPLIASDSVRQQAMRDELCIQRRMDGELNGVLATMAPNCISASEAIKQIKELIDSALAQLGPDNDTCPDNVTILPPTLQESLRGFDKASDVIDAWIARQENEQD